MWARGRPSAVIQSASLSAVPSNRDQRACRLCPNPGRSTVYVRKSAAKAGTFRLHQRPEPESPWSRMSGGPEPCTSKAREVNGPRSETRILLLILRLGNDRFNLDQFHQWLTP